MPALPITTFIEGDSISHGAHISRDTSSKSSSGDSARVWIIVAAVAALLTLSACIALVAIMLSKRRLVKQQLEEARQKDPCLRQKEFSRKRRMTQNDLILEAEEQREAMIRKSLASRSGRSISVTSNMTTESSSLHESSSMYRYGVKEGKGHTRKPSDPRSEFSLYDEKDCEAGYFSRPSSAAGLARTRPYSPLPEMPAPTLSRSSSPHRVPQALANQAVRPPLLEQHPLFQELNEDSDTETEHRR